MGNTKLMNAKGRATWVNADEQKLQKQTQFVRRRRSLRKLNDKQKKKTQKTLDTADVVRDAR